VSGEIERMFEECHGLVFRTAYRITGNAADAEDVLQAVFLRLLRRDRSAEPLDNPESYLRRAAINASLDIIRTRREQPSVPLDESPPGAVPDERDTRDCLRNALARLDPRSAEIFALRFFEGHTNPEIARMLGISQIYTGVVLHRARKQLQKEIKSYLGGKL
jgi:RNA polymerase sigma factor (sigma-70 family)